MDVLGTDVCDDAPKPRRSHPVSLWQVEQRADAVLAEDPQVDVETVRGHMKEADMDEFAAVLAQFL
jgi:hypothetical protein